MPHRRLIDLQGRSWDVWETRPGPRSRVSPQYREGWLTFETIDAPVHKRRLSPVPPEWHGLSDTELLRLLDGATVIDSARRSTVVALEESSAPPQSTL